MLGTGVVAVLKKFAVLSIKEKGHHKIIEISGLEGKVLLSILLLQEESVKDRLIKGYFACCCSKQGCSKTCY